VKALLRALAWLEDAFLVLLLLLMIGVSVLQIVLRNGFETGLPWGEDLVRVTVLWVALVGSMVATREGRHIRIDALVRFLPDTLRALCFRLVDLAAAGLCAALAWFGSELVAVEFEDGFAAFAAVPVWVTEVVIPVAFGVMGLRYLIHALTGRPPLVAPSP
jgi:TRAP-type C4-dicarboxylate transport system permease small subunit